MRTKLFKIAQAATLGIALAFTLSCSGDDGDEGGGGGGGNGGGSGPSINYEGETYKSVKINNLTWMAKNLNYNAPGSKCYDDDPANCAKYGRLYDWATAMALPSNCNTDDCASQISKQHKGICPSGWHIPNDVEWNALEIFVGSDEIGSNSKLRATSGWNGGNTFDENGTDDYGFSALPSGGYYGDLGFLHRGERTNWWKANYSDYGTGIYSSNDKENYYDMTNLFSVRCIQDYPTAASSVTYEGETYETVVIGTQTWMAKNLNYKAKDSKCYGEGGKVLASSAEYITLSDGEVQANCAKYGRLYDWATAMALPSDCNTKSCASQISVKHKGICPSGWHISSQADWEILKYAVVGKVVNTDYSGRELKATSGWINCGDGSSYTYQCRDTHGFAALPGGFGYYNNLEGSLTFGSFVFNGVGSNAVWWAQREGYNWPESAYVSGMGSSSTGMSTRDNFEKTRLYSVRCVQD
jgi:uncharacterized protein (TIGR02145 family)